LEDTAGAFAIRSTTRTSPEKDIVLTDRIDKRAPSARGRVGAKIAAHFAKSDWLIGAATTTVAAYFRLVGATSRIVYEPRVPASVFDELGAFIVTAWHGPAFLLPLVRPRGTPFDVLVSRHSDGELIARTLSKLGFGIIRGSRSADPVRTLQKGGISGFMKMRAALAKGRCVAVAADNSPLTGGEVSAGPIALAKASGRVIVPVGLASRHRIAVGSWDRAAVSLPFNLIACVIGDPIRVPSTADDAVLEAKRREVEATLNAATRRAFDIVDRRRG